MATSLESFMSNLMINKAQEAQEEGSSASSPAGACCSCVSISSDNARMMEHQRRRRASAPSSASRSRSTLLETTEKARQSIVAEALEICKGFGENYYDPTIDEAPKLPCRSPDSRAFRRKKVVSFTVAKSGIESHRESRWEAATAADCYNKDKQIQALQQQLNNTVPHKPRRSI